MKNKALNTNWQTSISAGSASTPADKKLLQIKAFSYKMVQKENP